MLLETPENKHTVIDVDIVLDFGVTVPLTIDPSKGDSFTMDDWTVQAHLESKPSIANPEVMMPAEDVTFFVSHIVSIQKREREVVELSPEQKAEQTKVFKEWGTIQ